MRVTFIALAGAVQFLCWAIFSFGEDYKALGKQLSLAEMNRGELDKALAMAKGEEKKGMEFMIANMPVIDLKTLSSDFLLENSRLTWQARSETPWGKAAPEGIFFNHVLPYANVDEKRDPWRKEFHALCMPLVKECKTASEAAQKLNRELFKILKVKYAPQRRAPNLSPKESIAQGNASCTGLSIILVDACRSVAIPARLVGTPNWFDKRGNHTWVEIWDKEWHFTGACEPDPNGLNRGWFVNDAAKAIQGSPEHGIFAASFGQSAQNYPLVWARQNKSVPGEEVTGRYTRNSQPEKMARVSVKVIDANKKRVTLSVLVFVPGGNTPIAKGESKSELADLNDFLSFELEPEMEYLIRVGNKELKFRSPAKGERQLIEIQVP